MNCFEDFSLAPLSRLVLVFSPEYALVFRKDKEQYEKEKEARHGDVNIGPA